MNDRDWLRRKIRQRVRGCAILPAGLIGLAALIGAAGMLAGVATG